MGVLDTPAPVRPGEELDLAALEKFLKDHLPALNGTIQVNQFPSGFSNLTYLVSIGDKRMVLRKPPLGTKPKSGHDMGREFRVLKALQPVFPYCPKPIAFCDDESVLGSPFYLMEQIQGIIIRREYSETLAIGPEQVRQQHVTLFDVFEELHSVDYEAIGLGDLGRPEGYCQRQVEGWSKRYVAAKTPDAPSYEKVMQWFHEKLPTALQQNGGERACLVHNDYKMDNVIWDPEDPTRIIGVLDWEMTTLGHPLMDLGNSLGYWVQKDDPQFMQDIRSMATNIAGALTRQEIVDRYAQNSGIPINHFEFFHAFGLFRLAVIAQQIYYRFHHGQTQDQRFQRLIRSVVNLEQASLSIIEQSDL